MNKAQFCQQNFIKEISYKTQPLRECSNHNQHSLKKVDIYTTRKIFLPRYNVRRDVMCFNVSSYHVKSMAIWKVVYRRVLLISMF